MPLFERRLARREDVLGVEQILGRELARAQGFHFELTPLRLVIHKTVVNIPDADVRQELPQRDDVSQFLEAAHICRSDARPVDGRRALLEGELGRGHGVVRLGGAARAARLLGSLESLPGQPSLGQRGGRPTRASVADCSASRGSLWCRLGGIWSQTDDKPACRPAAVDACAERSGATQHEHRGVSAARRHFDSDVMATCHLSNVALLFCSTQQGAKKI